LIWVDNNCAVRMFEGGEPVIISDNGLAEQIRQVDAMDLRASTFSTDQHVYYELTLGTSATWRYDLSTKNWTRVNSYGLDYSRTHLFANLGDTAIALDAITNDIWRLDPDRATDGDDTFTVEFMAFAEVEQPTPCASVELTCEVGGSPREGQGSDSLMRMRYSDDDGKTWSRFFDRGLGATGEYSTRVKWNALGFIRRRRIFHFQCSDPTRRRFSRLLMNAA
jgi:hypothetical protein